jgi:hypothetical protein
MVDQHEPRPKWRASASKQGLHLSVMAVKIQFSSPYGACTNETINEVSFNKPVKRANPTKTSSFFGGSDLAVVRFAHAGQLVDHFERHLSMHQQRQNQADDSERDKFRGREGRRSKLQRRNEMDRELRRVLTFVSSERLENQRSAILIGVVRHEVKMSAGRSGLYRGRRKTEDARSARATLRRQESTRSTAQHDENFCGIKEMRAAAFAAAELPCIG